LHEREIIFGDLKPSNVLLNEYGNLKLSDFGNSKKLSDLIPSEENEKPSKGHAGTPYYMAPELFTDEGILSF
jgi:serine/threonine-protein kinase ULK4